MNHEQARQDIHDWIMDFVEVANPALAGWPPCPYARAARLRGSVDIRPGTDPYSDLETVCNQGLAQYEVVIYVYDPAAWSHSTLATSIELANQEFLVGNNLIALEDHPHDPEIVNGIVMNQGTWALALVQSLSDLNSKAQQLAMQGFYQNWPQDYLQQLFRHRRDPRT